MLLGYLLLFGVWPSVVFHRYLKGKTIAFRFGFCVLVPMMIMNSVVLGLGLLHLLNRWTILLFFYGVFAWSVYRIVKSSGGKEIGVKRVLHGTFGFKNFILWLYRQLTSGIKRLFCFLWKRMGDRKLEYLLLAVLVIYGMIYFSYGSLQTYSYGSSDMYTHHSWVYGLIGGEVFSAGVYPEAMHCVIYALHTLFGIRVYSCFLFLAGIQAAVLLISVYFLMRELFHWKYSAFFMLALFLTIDLVEANEIFGMARLQWTIPQEFGLYSQFLCLFFLIRFVRGEGRKGKWYRDENLLLFMMAIAVSIAVHFYITMMAFFLCAAFALCSLRRVFDRKHFLPLVASVVCGVLLAAAPMAGALASGIPFQGSIGWAMNIMNGTDTKEGRTPQKESEPAEETEEAAESGQEESQSGAGEADGNGGLQSGAFVGLEDERGSMEAEEMTESQSDSRLWKILYAVREKVFGIYWFGYESLYQERAGLIVGFTIAAAIFWCVYRIVIKVFHKLGRMRELLENRFDGHLTLILASVLFMLLYAAPLIGLPELIAGARLCSTGQLLIVAVFVIPADILFSFWSIGIRKSVLQRISALCVPGIYAAVNLLGMYHGYLYYDLTRYNAAVMVTDSIINTLPENSYTIVSTTSELYQVNQYGRHEELVRFVNYSRYSDYRLPTEYVFLYVEKQPLEYAQKQFFTGPSWLADDGYIGYVTTATSQYPDVLASEISEEAAEKQVMSFVKLSDNYSDPESRTILQSKAFQWCQCFDQLYPNEMKIYYEDDQFVCYYFKQNPNALYDLAVMQ